METEHKHLLYVVGMGPGAWENMTIEAAAVLQACEVIVGYTVYVDLLRSHLADKTFLTTPMTREIERCEMAFREASLGRRTAMVCSGDAGVYGMASPVLTVGARYPAVAVRIVPGVTAALSGAALLGAPLTHDFCAISLSDRLTPLETIWARVDAAARADFVIVFYNPASKKRADYLRQACDRLLAVRNPDTLCGVTRDIGRQGESCAILTLRELRDYPADMFTTVFVGNAETRVQNGRLVTPRGYRDV